MTDTIPAGPSRSEGAESAFWVTGGPLRITNVIEQPDPGPRELAFLSACQAAIGSPRALDEAINLASTPAPNDLWSYQVCQSQRSAARSSMMVTVQDRMRSARCFAGGLRSAVRSAVVLPRVLRTIAFEASHNRARVERPGFRARLSLTHGEAYYSVQMEGGRLPLSAFMLSRLYRPQVLLLVRSAYLSERSSRKVVADPEQVRCGIERRIRRSCPT
jgi:hypothetical protein